MGIASVDVELPNSTSPVTEKFTDFSDLFLLNGSGLRSRGRFNEGQAMTKNVIVQDPEIQIKERQNWDALRCHEFKLPDEMNPERLCYLCLDRD